MTTDEPTTVEYRETLGTWRGVADSACITVDVNPGTKEPSNNWVYRMLLAEHSPIRKRSYSFVLHNLRSWVSVHFVRHKFGVEHWVRSQRTDRTGVDRETLPQGARVDHEMLANAQALIFISRKRLCMKASPETRDAWQMVRVEIGCQDACMAAAMVPDCIYRGYCYEMKSCGYHLTEDYRRKLHEYRTLPSGDPLSL